MLFERDSFLPVLYKRFVLYISCISLQSSFIVRPFRVGRDKKSLSIVLPSEIVKLLHVNPLSVFLLLSTNGLDEINLKIIREEDLTKKDIGNVLPAADKVMQPSQQSSSSSSSDAIPEIVRRGGGREDYDLVQHVINETEDEKRSEQIGRI
jgi:hypothetical protein